MEKTNTPQKNRVTQKKDAKVVKMTKPDVKGSAVVTSAGGENKTKEDTPPPRREQAP